MRRRKTIFRKIFIPLFLVMVIQISVFVGLTAFGPITKTLNDNASEIINERVDNRKNELETFLTKKWGNLDDYQTIINKDFAQYNYQEFLNNNEQKKQLLVDNYHLLVELIRKNEVNGAFIILANSPFGKENTIDQVYYALSIRDYDTNSTYNDDNADLLVNIGPSSIIPDMNISLDSTWESVLRFNSQNNVGDYFFKPLTAAFNFPGISSDNLAYLDTPHNIAESDRELISYSIPLVSSNHEVYGVLGVELTTTALESIIPSEELYGENSGSYLIVSHQSDSDDNTVIAKSGILFTRLFNHEKNITLPTSHSENTSSFVYQGQNDLSAYCYESTIRIYNDNTPFENNHLSLIGSVEYNKLYAMADSVRHNIMMVSTGILVFGIIAIFIVSHMLSMPIQRLADQVRDNNDDNSNLQHINIYEIDQLVDTIMEKTQTINRSQVRTEFFSKMSHDMRTPMNAIIGFSSQEITNGSNKQELVDYLNKINRSGQYLLGLINEVLDMTKIDSGNMELENGVINTSECWDSILAMINELAQNKGVIFIKEIEETPAKYVYGDDQRLTQIYMNLLSNAIKFTPKGGTVTLIAQSHLNDDQSVDYVVTVKDTGIGMSQVFLDNLYQPFSQEHPNREGTGLGLSITKQLITLMGGTIECSSTKNKGTKFVTHIKLKIANDQTSQNEITKNLTDDEILDVLKEKRVLLCEDQPLNRQIACKLLNKYQMIVDSCENGKLGYQTFKDSPDDYYDYILMDIRMPIMDGLQSTALIRQLERADAKTIPIIAMTANAFKEDIEASTKAGMDEHLSKPIEPQILFNTLVKYARKK